MESKTIFKAAGQCGSMWLLNNTTSSSDGDPCVIVTYSKDLFPTPNIEAKYDKAATPMTFNAFEIFNVDQSLLATDYLCRALTDAQIKEINDFLEKT